MDDVQDTFRPSTWGWVRGTAAGLATVLLGIAGIVAIWLPAPVLPTMNSLSSRSCQVLIGESCQATQKTASVFMLPIQFI